MNNIKIIKKFDLFSVSVVANGEFGMMGEIIESKTLTKHNKESDEEFKKRIKRECLK